ncbi:type II CRISPR-associated endonuclease Cas1 [Apilactobacillus kunkeei]|uniref:type II CRISPR-associated endonuclease Cas1 n=1 Tax=Apilactobacillus kunkeei TaxID=148814 RepID=UPI0006B243A6|nr:type II CRISPR-associated endonuclease Cas1 [Apilactobacillus kunkeei]KOY70198.1 CRISPR-associated endonuclease Cas1 [Apilactobacillus kunkeei]MBC6388670.1 type II CRISPR-associated endonuclease Cas1 [Apilactobacillus kunkeei]CAI2656380.1 CRISPR-associated endonuclease Cas1 [Apilactobacillus kunkeei]
MGWRSVIVSSHAKISYSSNCMIVQTIEGIHKIPIDDIYLLLICTTQAVITTELINRLNKVNAKIIFSDEYQNPACEIVNNYPNNKNIEKITKQIFWDDGRKEVLWTKIVTRKMINQLAVLKYKHKDNIQDIKNEIDKIEIGDSSNREAVVARKYFKSLFHNGFSRNQNLVINAALNYGYSILLSNFNREIVSQGFSTYIGIHHHSVENSFNLSSDLMEPFRPIIDYWVSCKKMNSLTPDIKFGLVEILNMEIFYKEKEMLVKTAINKYVADCFDYLNDGKNFDLKVELKNEVPNNAIDNNV